MKRFITYKSIGAFIFLNLIFIALLSFEIYKDFKKQEEEHIQNRLTKISLQSIITLQEYHKDILDSQFIDPQTYLSVVKDASSFVQRTNLVSIKSYLKEGDKFLLTATSVTKSQFVARDYPLYRSEATDDLAFLTKAYNKNKQDISENQEYISEIFDKEVVAVNINIEKRDYIILIKINREDVLREFDIFKIMHIIFLGLFFITIIFFIYITHTLYNEIFTIRGVLSKFFTYVTFNKDKSSIEFLDYNLNNKLNNVLRDINEGMQRVISEKEENTSNSIKDNKLIDEMKECMTFGVDGSFDTNILLVASNPKLNELKDVTNSMSTRINSLFIKLNYISEKYIKNDFTDTIAEDDYKDKSVEVIRNINKVGINYSDYLSKNLDYLIDISVNTKSINSYIEENIDSLDNILVSLKKVADYTEADYKFAFEFDNSITVIKRENVYVNNLLDGFGKKYEDSISMINDLKEGIFENNPNLFISRINALVKDSSIRDTKKQEELIDKVRELSTVLLDDNSSDEIEDLLKLLLDEMLKDIRYSLYLIETKVSKLSADSSSRVVSTKEVRDITKSLKDNIANDVTNADKIEDIIIKMLNTTNDFKYGIIEDNEFIGKNNAINLLKEKGDL